MRILCGVVCDISGCIFVTLFFSKQKCRLWNCRFVLSAPSNGLGSNGMPEDVFCLHGKCSSKSSNGMVDVAEAMTRDENGQNMRRRPTIKSTAIHRRQYRNFAAVWSTKPKDEIYRRRIRSRKRFFWWFCVQYSANVDWRAHLVWPFFSSFLKCLLQVLYLFDCVITHYRIEFITLTCAVFDGEKSETHKMMMFDDMLYYSNKLKENLLWKPCFGWFF